MKNYIKQFLSSYKTTIPPIPTNGLLLRVEPNSMVISSGNITSWTDLSGNGNNLTPNNTIAVTTLNGFNAAQCDGHYLSITTTPVNFATGFTLFAVANAPGGGVYNEALGLGTGSGGQIVCSLNIASTNSDKSVFVTSEYGVNGYFAYTTSIPSPGVETIIHCRLDASAVMTIKQSGDPVGSPVSETSGYGYTSGEIYIAGSGVVNIVAALVYNRPLSDSEVTTVRTYLTKYGPAV